MNKLLIVFLFLSCGLHVISQNRITNTSNNGWYSYLGNHRIAEKFLIHTEYQWRRADIVSTWQQSLKRVGLEYKITDNVLVANGYAYIATWPYGNQPALYTYGEHRLWQQLVVNQKIGRFYINHRYRMEERWLQNKVINKHQEYEHAYFVYRNRARYRFMLTIPITHKELTNNSLFITVNNEAFVSFGKNVAKNIFDQNRLYGGIGLWVNNKTNVQVGYMYHTNIKPDAIQVENNNNLLVAITHHLNLFNN